MTTLQKLWHMLTAAQRRAALLLLALMLIGMVLETLGIGLIIPALALMTQSDITSKYPEMAPWLARLGNPDHNKLIIGGMLALVSVYAVKALFLSFLAWRQARFVAWMQEDISRRLFTAYLRQPYVFHLQRNSAQLIRNVVTETYLLTQTGFISGLNLATEILVIVGISGLLLAVEPVGALVVVTTAGLAGWGIVHLPRRHILRWGKARQLHEGLRIQSLQEGLGSAKDVILLGREQEFVRQYQVHNAAMAKLGERQVTVQQIPRLALEFIAVSGLAALVLIMIAQGKPTESLLPSLGLFAAAAFRFLPSVNRIIYALQSVRYALPVIDTLYSELGLLDGTDAPKRGRTLQFEKALMLDQISYSYPSAERQVLRGVSISVPRGASVGFIGGSGAGKSTLVDIILGLLTPVSGTVSVDAVDIQSCLRGWQDQIGYVPQSIFLTDDTLRRNVAFGVNADQIDEAAVRRAISAAQLDQFVSDLPEGLDTLVGERGVRLSGGQRQRIGIARALYHEPSVLVLDEATSSLDTDTERGVMEAVRALQGHKTVLIVAHRLSTVEHCDRLFRIERGQIVEEGETAVMLGKIASGPISPVYVPAPNP